jgi:hypothetical protein
MSQFGKDRFPPGYQSAVGMNARQLLHDNSVELTNLLKENNVLKNSKSIFELGSGPARNLYYIWLENKKIKLYCSDLFKDASLENMHPSIKDLVTFYEGDSEDIIESTVILNLDIFLVSDHFMHLQYEKARNIINGICTKWKPNYIVLREIKKEFETPNHPRLYHDYNRFLETYEITYSGDSRQDTKYFIWILKKK